MEFKVLLRTAEADVLAFASAAPHRLVRSRMVSVLLTGNFRLSPRRLQARDVSSESRSACEGAPRWNGTRNLSPGQVPPAVALLECLVSRISERRGSFRSQSSRLEKAGDGSVISHLPAGDRTEKIDLQAARLTDGLVETNPSNPFRLMPHPMAALAEGEPQLQLQFHAITPTAGR
jgi:hypothetical protein